MSFPAEEPAVIVTAGRVHTQAEAQTGNALLVEAGRVRAVGSVDALRQRAPHLRIVDLGEATITPGLTDSHIHITEWAMARRDVDLAGARRPEDAAALIARHGRPRSNGWLLGRGWNPHHWGGAYPERALLDQVVPDRPAAFQSHDMHALWVNTRALEAAGISRDSVDPPGGRIVRDAQGNPAGVLLENAALLVIGRIAAPSDLEVLEAVINAQAELHRYGITGIHSFPGFHLIEPQPLRILERLQEQGRLRLRVLQHLALDQLECGPLTRPAQRPGRRVAAPGRHQDVPGWCARLAHCLAARALSGQPGLRYAGAG